MRLFVLILLVLDIILAEKQIINCQEGYQPYAEVNEVGDSRRGRIIEDVDMEFNNCIFHHSLGYYNEYTFIESNIVFNNCIFHSRLDIDKSTAEFNNIEFLSDQVDFKDSEIIIRKSVFYFNHSHYMASSRKHPYSIWESSTVDIYDSTIYRDKDHRILSSCFDIREPYPEENKKITFHGCNIVNTGNVIDNYIRIYKNGLDLITSQPSPTTCPDNHIIKNVTKAYVGQVIYSGKKGIYYDEADLQPDFSRGNLKTIDNYDGCKPCPENEYSTNSQICRPCNFGNSWERKTSSCIPCFKQEWCPTAFTCKENHEGVGCDMCSVGYFMVNLECIECPTGTRLIISIFVGSIIAIIVGVSFSKIVNEKPELAKIFVVIISHFQILVLITDIKIDFPDYFKEILDTVKSWCIELLKNHLINTKCLGEYTYVERFYFNSFLPTMFWIFLMILSPLFLKCINCFSKKKMEYKKFVSNISYTCMNIFYVFQLSRPLTIFSTMVIDDTVVLRDNRSMSTKDEQWKLMMAFSFFYFSWLLLKPIIFLLGVFKKNKEKEYEIITELYGKKLLITCWTIIPTYYASFPLIFITLLILSVIHFYSKEELEHQQSYSNIILQFYFLEMLYVTTQFTYQVGGFDVDVLSYVLSSVYIFTLIVILYYLLKNVILYLINRNKNYRVKSNSII